MADYAVALSGKAREDIRDVYAYYDGVLCDRARALATYRELKEAVLSLGTLPKRRPLLQDPEFAEKGLRSLRCGRYLVFYIVQEVPPTVVVVRVLHERREWACLLEPSQDGRAGSEEL